MSTDVNTLNESTDQIKMYIIINGDLKMSPGKMIAQCCHIVQIITDELVRDGYENYPPSINYINYMKWCKNCTKIILKATEEQLKKLMTNNNNVRCFYDNGITTQVKPGSLTVIGFFPASPVDQLIHNLKLVG